jgi:hypothetical protein
VSSFEESNAMNSINSVLVLFIAATSLSIGNLSAQASNVVLRQVVAATCDVGILDPPNAQQIRNCSMLTGFQSVPNISVALFLENGGVLSPCCGDLVITFRAQLFRNGAEVLLTGRRTLDSAMGAQAAVTFR